MKYTPNKYGWSFAVHQETEKDGFCFVRENDTENFIVCDSGNRGLYRIFKDGKPFFDDFLFFLDPCFVKKTKTALSKDRFVFLYAAVKKYSHLKNIYPSVCIVDTLCGNVVCLFNAEKLDSEDCMIFENVLYSKMDKVVVYLPSMEILADFSSALTSVVADNGKSFVVKDIIVHGADCAGSGDGLDKHVLLIDIDKQSGDVKVIYQ